jgi:hypothetical protein
MFFADKVEAFANIGSALRPGGRMLLVAWKGLVENEQFHTMFSIMMPGREVPTPPPGAPSPFGLADTSLTASWLEAAGFADVAFDAVLRPFILGTDADDAYDFACDSPIVASLATQLDPEARAAALGALRDVIDAHATPEGVIFDSATWFITATRP